VNFLILLVVFALVAVRVVKPEDRRRYLAVAMASLRQLKTAATTPRPAYEAFVAALRRRTPRALAAPAIVAIDALIFVLMVGGSTPMSDPATLVAWGANLGTRTTNGEWWRLLTSTFLHAGVLQLGVETIVLLHGALVERFVGRAAFAVVFVSAGVMAGVTHISAHPVDVGTSAVGALSGLYGLMAACVLWSTIRGRREIAPEEDAELLAQIAVPPIAIKRITVVGVLFFLVSAIDGLAGGMLTGFIVGLGCGAAVGWSAADRTSGWRPVAGAGVACAAAAIIWAVPLRNIADVKPEVDHVVAIETRTAAAYATAFDRFTHQRISGDALADLADGAIVELEAADARLGALQHVPPEHQPLVADAREFLRLRCASWRARADALRRAHKNLRAAPVGGDPTARVQAEGRYRSTMAAAGKAEAAERTASEAFARVKIRATNPAS